MARRKNALFSTLGPAETLTTGASRLLVVGQRGGTNVGDSLYRAAQRMAIGSTLLDMRAAAAAPRWLRFISWRLADHRPARLNACSKLVVDACRQLRPRWVLATGLVPLNASALVELGRMGISRLNYLTDDPWNPTLRSRWSLAALHEYDHVYSVRRANLRQLIAHGCMNVSYVPFGFDPELFFPDRPDQEDCDAFATDVLFVGGADRERVPFIAALAVSGVRVAVYGDYWSRFAETRACHRGYGDIATLRKATSTAKVNLCLVRRANRDGQVMRSYEAAAIGACMLVEDTPEHRELFGSDGEAVLYFRSIDDMLARVKYLLASPDERLRLGSAVRHRIVSGRHTYDDRLTVMLQQAA
jgi:spore maturation protein CgeB